MGWCVWGKNKKKTKIIIKKGIIYYAHWHSMALETWHLLGQILLSAGTKRLRPQLVYTSMQYYC